MHTQTMHKLSSVIISLSILLPYCLYATQSIFGTHQHCPSNLTTQTNFCCKCYSSAWSWSKMAGFDPTTSQLRVTNLLYK